jgi:hypothetical protein
MLAPFMRESNASNAFLAHDKDGYFWIIDKVPHFSIGVSHMFDAMRA